MRGVAKITADHISETAKARRLGNVDNIDNIVRQNALDTVWTGVYDVHLSDKGAIENAEADISIAFDDRIAAAFTLAKAFEAEDAPEWQ